MDIDSIQQHRLIVAIKTPYDTKGNIDLHAYDQSVERLIAAGVQGIVVGGTTGEGHLLSWDEHIMIIAHSVHNFGDRLLIIGNTGSNSTREARQATEHGFAVGMHAALLVNPYYGKTSRTGLRQHFKTCLDVGPGFIYNVPSRTAQDIDTDLMQELSKHPSFVGVKECGGSERIAELSKLGIHSWSGNDDQLFADVHEHGATGCISVTANLVPRLFANMLQDASQSAINDSLQKLYTVLFCEPSPIALNTLMAMLGLCQPVMRLPYVPLSSQQQQQAIDALSSLDIAADFPQAPRVLADSEFHIL